MLCDLDHLNPVHCGATFGRSFGHAEPRAHGVLAGGGSLEGQALRNRRAGITGYALQADLAGRVHTGGSMSRSTLRCALGAGALCLTATTTAALAPAAADAARIGVGAKRLNIQTGSRVS